MSDSKVNKSDDGSTSEDSEIAEILSKPVKYNFGARTQFQMKTQVSQSKVSQSQVASRKSSKTFQSSSYQDFGKKVFKSKSSSCSNLSFATHAADQSPKRNKPVRIAKNESSSSVQNTKEYRFIESIINRCELLWKDIYNLEPRPKRTTSAFKLLSPEKPTEFKNSPAGFSFKTHQNTYDETEMSTEPSHQSQAEELSEASFGSVLKLKDHSTGNTSSSWTSQETGCDSNVKLTKPSPPSKIENLSQLTFREPSELEGTPAASDSSSRITGATCSNSVEPYFAPSAGKIKALESLMDESFNQFNKKALELNQNVTLHLKEIECMTRNCPDPTKSFVFKKYECIDLRLTELQTLCLNYKSKIEAGHLKNLGSQSSSLLKDDKTEDSEYVPDLHKKYSLAENFIKLMEKFEEINKDVHMFLSKFSNWN